MVKESNDTLNINALRKKLAKQGILLDAILGSTRPIKAVALDLRNSLKELSEKTRDQVVMARIDEDTCNILDAWIETGTVKSRSEGAALFLKEGLKYHASELDELKDELTQLREAKEKLQQAAKQIFDKMIENGNSENVE